MSFLRAIERLETAAAAFQGKGLTRVVWEAMAAASVLPQTGATIIDAGAHWGQWTRALLDIAGDRVRRVYALEPASLKRERLSDLPSPPVELVGAALSDAPGVATLYGKSRGSVDASLHRRDLSHVGHRQVALEQVETMSLPGVMTEYGIDRVDYLKMDIEGHELAVLSGARSVLAERRIGAFSFEFGPVNIDVRTFCRDYWNFVSDLEYRLYRIVPGGRLFPITQYGKELETFRTSNYVALSPEVYGSCSILTSGACSDG